MNLMVRFYLIIKGLWVCSKDIYCLCLLGLYRVMKLHDQPSVPPPSGVLPNTEASNNHPLVPPLSRALPIAETSSEQPL
ncbi:hypothetical protein ACFX1T_043636 [Malus domestica]